MATEQSASSMDFGAVSMVTLVAFLSVGLAVVLAVVLVRRSHASGGTEPLLGESGPRDDA